MMARVPAESPEDIRRRMKRASMGGKRVPEQASYVTDVQVPVKKHRRSKSKQLREIKKYQSTADLLMPRAPFQRLVREIGQSMSPAIRFRESSIEALQEASEAFIIGMMEDGLLCTVHANRVTLMRKDVALAERIRGD
jgi:histone H3